MDIYECFGLEPKSLRFIQNGGDLTRHRLSVEERRPNLDPFPLKRIVHGEKEDVDKVGDPDIAELIRRIRLVHVAATKIVVITGNHDQFATVRKKIIQKLTSNEFCNDSDTPRNGILYRDEIDQYDVLILRDCNQVQIRNNQQNTSEFVRPSNLPKIESDRVAGTSNSHTVYTTEHFMGDYPRTPKPMNPFIDIK